MSSVSPGAFSIFCFRYLPSPSWVIPRWTGTSSLGTSANLMVLFWPAQIASERSLPTFSASMSKEAGNGLPGVGGLVVLDALHERRGAVAHSHDGHAHLL